MRKYTKIAYVAVILLIILIGFFMYKVSGKNEKNEDIKSKTLSEIKYIESKFLNLFNQINNINFDKYKISASEIKESEQKQSSNSSEDSSGNSSQGSGSKGSSESEGEESGNSENSKDSQNSEKSSDSSEKKQKYKLEETGILTKDTEINWDQIKNNVEDMYSYLYTTTLDLYQITNEQQDIVNFNKEYDNLTKTVKDEDKEGTLFELATLYDYLPKFMENCTSEEKEKAVIKTKNKVFKAYSILDTEDWPSISENVNSAIQEFTKIVTDINNQEKGNQYNINKAYIMINELQNAVILKDKEVFLIKYKNLLEELENI